MGFLCLDISTFVAIKSRIIRIRNPDVFHENEFCILKREAAPGEARTHGLQIMRLTRCLLRYRGFTRELAKISEIYKTMISSKYLPYSWALIFQILCNQNGIPTGGLEPPIFGLGDRRLIH